MNITTYIKQLRRQRAIKRIHARERRKYFLPVLKDSEEDSIYKALQTLLLLTTMYSLAYFMYLIH